MRKAEVGQPLLSTAVARLVLIVALAPFAGGPPVQAGVAQADAPPGQPADLLADAQRLFYSGRYEEASALAVTLQSSDVEALAAYELHTSAVHFQIKRLIGDAENKGRALAQCAECPRLLTEFRNAFLAGRALAREKLKADPHDEAGLFFVGKIDLNHVWLHLGTLGRKTGWDEYWEARRSLDALLKRNPAHVRARVARAWIDYIVDTRVPWAIRWVLGGGDKKRALAALGQAAREESDYFVKTEAAFGLWEMLVRERRIPEALVVARELARDFPENRELTRFLEANAAVSGPAGSPQSTPAARVLPPKPS